jgi:phosphate starvation-inducible PhoH-like protein
MIDKLTEKQKEYLRLIEKYDLCFLTGAAGTGKTYIACLSAIEFLERKKVEKLIISRPLVTTEEVGILPGTLGEKIDPFMDPIIGMLKEIYSKAAVNKMISAGQIETVPLAFMRGRTFKNSFVILDEAQNTTKTQISMFLTRFGINSKGCVIGDLKQSDLPRPSENGLKWAKDKLEPSKLVTNIHFDSEQVVRSPLVKEVMKYLYASETSNTVEIPSQHSQKRLRA